MNCNYGSLVIYIYIYIYILYIQYAYTEISILLCLSVHMEHILPRVVMTVLLGYG